MAEASRILLNNGTRGWLGFSRLARTFPATLARAQHVEAHPRDHRRQPSAEVLNAARAGAAEMEPGLLDGVVRLALRTELRYATARRWVRLASRLLEGRRYSAKPARTPRRRRTGSARDERC